MASATGTQREHVSERRDETDEVRPYPGYRWLWVWLGADWLASGADRTITGLAVT